jgi:2-dehydropantoate 2-reductase
MADKPQQDVLIAGTGALACLYAARLSAKGISVTMVGTWAEGLAALRMYGVTLVQSDGRQTSYPVQVVGQGGPCTPAKYALVLVKSWQTERAAKQLARCLTPDGVALTLQNGLGNVETLSVHLGEARVAQGVTTTGATLLSSGRVRPGGEGIVTVAEHPRLPPLIEMLTKAGFKTETDENVQSLVWGKLAVNAAINPLTAILKMDNIGIIFRPSARRLAAELALEVAAVANAKGISLPYADPVQVVEEVANKTGSNYSSMYQDILRDAPTEIDAICGAVVQAGAEVGVPTPANWTLWHLIHALVEENSRI